MVRDVLANQLTQAPDAGGPNRHTARFDLARQHDSDDQQRGADPRPHRAVHRRRARPHVNHDLLIPSSG
jgi:hypothetical protein